MLVGEHAVEPTAARSSAGVLEAFPFRSRRGGTASAVRVYLGPASRASTLLVGLYSDRKGHPASLLTAGSLRSPEAHRWNSVPVGSASLRSGVIYWIAVLGKGGAIYFRDRNSRSCKGESSSKRRLRSLPRTWPGGTNSDTCLISAYVEGAARSVSSGDGTNAPTGTSSTVENAPSLVPTTSAVPTATAPAGTPEAANEQQSPPVATAPPTISGSPAVGTTLATSSGSWINSPTSYAYQWQDCASGACATISGATGSTYTLQSHDVGQSVDVVVTATNAGGSASATSPAVGPVSAATAASVSAVTTSNVTPTTATFTATVNPNGIATTVAFEYGTTTSYGLTTPDQAIGSGTTPKTVTASVTGLSPGTTYHVRAVAVQ